MVGGLIKGPTYKPVDAHYYGAHHTDVADGRYQTAGGHN